MKHSKSLAIIGSSGMVGSNLAQILKPYFQTVTGIDRKNYEQYRGKNFDVVINANGNSNKRWAKDHVLEDFAASTISVYQSLFDFTCKTYIYISSADVYSGHTSTRTTNESTTLDPENLAPYGFHKYVSECIIRNFTKNHLILRCPVILGTNLRKGPIYDILRDARLFVSPNSTYQMLTTKELARIIAFLLGQNIINQTFNVGGRGKVPLDTLIKKVKRQVAFPHDGETHLYQINVSKLQKIYHLKTSAQYLKDFLKNYIILKS